jgi:CRP/FNR family transcriptional regulator, cyclic AMP receptor protein
MPIKLNMADAAKQTNVTSMPSPGPVQRKLKKGELLFAEGEHSRAMYLLKAGMIRIFKKKGDSQIELDTIRSGQVLGELAFLDGNPRSASGEALIDCELMEISDKTFQQEIVRMPEWLKMLLKTIVGRLRTASTRIRQLESASTAMDYSDKSGKRTANYIYLSPIDVLKILTSILLVASRNQNNEPGADKSTEPGLELRLALVNRYGNQIMGIPLAKITTLLDVLGSASLVTTVGERTALHDLPFIEQFITYLNNENIAEPSKRHDLTPRSFLIMGMIAKHASKFPRDPRTDLTLVNIVKVRELETGADGKEPFRLDDFQPLVEVGYCTSLQGLSATEMITLINAEQFILNCRFQRVAFGILAANVQKRR